MTGETEVPTGKVNARRGAVQPHGPVWNVTVAGHRRKSPHGILTANCGVKNLAANSLSLLRVPHTLELYFIF